MCGMSLDAQASVKLHGGGTSDARAVEKLLTDRMDRRQDRARLTTRLETVEAELKRHTDAVAAGISVTTLAEALSAQELERRRIREQLKCGVPDVRQLEPGGELAESGRGIAPADRQGTGIR